jgi:hypothetical protein
MTIREALVICRDLAVICAAIVLCLSLTGFFD